MSTVLIRPYRPADQEMFSSLNTSWIQQHFSLEEKDRMVLSHPEEYVLKAGGQILVAEMGDEVVGCCALTPIDSQSVELSKMVVARHQRGKGIGEELLRQSIAWTKDAGFPRLYLETSNKLPAAIRLYQRCGFAQVPPEQVVPSVYARADVYMEVWLR